MAGQIEKDVVRGDTHVGVLTEETGRWKAQRISVPIVDARREITELYTEEPFAAEEHAFRNRKIRVKDPWSGSVFEQGDIGDIQEVTPEGDMFVDFHKPDQNRRYALRDKMITPLRYDNIVALVSQREMGIQGKIRHKTEYMFRYKCLEGQGATSGIDDGTVVLHFVQENDVVNVLDVRDCGSRIRAQIDLNHSRENGWITIENKASGKVLAKPLNEGAVPNALKEESAVPVAVNWASQMPKTPRVNIFSQKSTGFPDIASPRDLDTLMSPRDFDLHAREEPVSRKPPVTFTIASPRSPRAPAGGKGMADSYRSRKAAARTPRGQAVPRGMSTQRRVEGRLTQRTTQLATDVMERALRQVADAQEAKKQAEEKLRIQKQRQQKQKLGGLSKPSVKTQPAGGPTKPWTSYKRNTAGEYKARKGPIKPMNYTDVSNLTESGRVFGDAATVNVSSLNITYNMVDPALFGTAPPDPSPSPRNAPYEMYAGRNRQGYGQI